MKNYYQRIDTEGAVLQGLATLYSKGNTLYFRLPDKLGLGRNKYISTGLPNKGDGRAKAKNILTALNNDILLGTFDLTLERYLPKHKTKEHLAAVEKHIGDKTHVSQLWDTYCESKEGKVKSSTMHYLTETIGFKIKQLQSPSIYDAEEHKGFLLAITTPDYAKRVMTKLNTLFDWCHKRGMLSGTNPYPLVLESMVTKPQQKTTARPLTDDEVDALDQGLTEHFANVLNFMLLTGCRPSEAIGLTWDRVDYDNGVIVLGSSKVKKAGKTFESDSSKNGKLRGFPLTAKLHVFLNALPSAKGLVFPNSQGNLIDYTAFSKAWVKILPNTTPYSARDTFITRQIELGKPIATVAHWVDNSVSVIEDRYYKPSGKIIPE